MLTLGYGYICLLLPSLFEKKKNSNFLALGVSGVGLDKPHLS